MPDSTRAFREYVTLITKTDIRIFVFLVCFCALLKTAYILGASFWSYEELFYTMGARKILGGSILYKDFVDIKPPGIYLVYSALIKIFGYGNILQAIKVATLGFEIVTAFVLYKIGEELFNKQKALILALAFCTALSLDRTGWLLYVFLITLLPWALCIFFLIRKKFRLKSADLFVSGVCLGFTVVCSTHYVVFILLLPGVLYLTKAPGREIFSKGTAFLLGFLVPVLIAGAYFFLHGALYDWYWCNFVWAKYYNGEYSFAGALLNLAASLPATYAWISFYILAVLGIRSFYRDREKIPKQNYTFIVLLAALLLLSRLLLSRPAARYNIYLLPIIALFVSCVDFSRIRREFLLVGGFGTALLFIWVNAQAIAYTPDHAIAGTARVSDWIAGHVTAKEKIFIWSNGIYLYHSSGREMATGFFFPGLYLDNPGMAARMRPEDTDYIWQKFRAQLGGEPPSVIVDITGNFSAANENARPAKIRENMSWFRDFMRVNYVLARDFSDFSFQFENQDSHGLSESVKIWRRR